MSRRMPPMKQGIAYAIALFRRIRRNYKLLRVLSISGSAYSVVACQDQCFRVFSGEQRQSNEKAQRKRLRPHLRLQLKCSRSLYSTMSALMIEDKFVTVE
jgi:hypothetical protein